MSPKTKKKDSQKRSHVEEMAKSARTAHSDLIERIVNAARKEEIKLDKRAISVGIGPSGVLVNAAVAGLAEIDMIRYEQGVLTNFIYIDSERTPLDPGFYSVTTVARFVRLGRIDIRAHYTRQGALLAASQGFALISSLRVPTDVPPSVDTGVGVLQAPDAPDQDADRVPQFTYYTHCTNGGYTCHSIPCPGGC